MLCEPVMPSTPASDTLIARHYRFAGAVATLNAVHGAQTVQDYREAATQIAIADRIALAKTDIAAPQAAAAARQLLAERNPTAGVLATTPDNIDRSAPALFEDLQAGHLDTVPAQAGSPATPIAHVLRYDIASYVWRQTGPIGWEAYARWMRYLQQHMGERLRASKACCAGATVRCGPSMACITCSTRPNPWPSSPVSCPPKNWPRPCATWKRALEHERKKCV